MGNDYTPLHLAVLQSRLDSIKMILESNSEFLLARDKKGYTSIMLAAALGKVEAFKILFDISVQKSGKTTDEIYALHTLRISKISEVEGNESVVNFNLSLFLIAAANGKKEILEVILASINPSLIDVDSHIDMAILLASKNKDKNSDAISYLGNLRKEEKEKINITIQGFKRQIDVMPTNKIRIEAKIERLSSILDNFQIRDEIISSKLSKKRKHSDAAGLPSTTKKARTDEASKSPLLSPSFKNKRERGIGIRKTGESDTKKQRALRL
jgi:hypothetical protein